jgi:hypothetical protein
MAHRLTRRNLLKSAALAAGAAAGVHLARGPVVLAAGAPTAKLGVAQIGCGGRGTGAHLPKVVEERLIAVVDADENQAARSLKYLKDNAAKFKLADLDLSKVRVFTDYRKMFDALGADLDAVSIATPDHQHALPSLMAMQRGKHVYCEKPLTHNIHEARVLGEAARKSKVATQMGNQGLGTGGDPALKEYLEAGAIGAVKEVHLWHAFGDRFGGSFARPETLPVPKGLDWDLWLGPAPAREYHARLHPGYWHGYHDFGTGSLGGWGTHVWDAADFALDLGYPTAVEVLEMDDPSDERFPMRTTVRYDFPANGKRPALAVFWYEGGRAKGAKVGPEDDNEAADTMHRPRLAGDIEKKYDRKLGGAGTLYVGEKGVIHTGSHGAAPRIVPEDAHKAFPVPAQTVPRIKGGIWGDFVRRAKEGGPACVSDFAEFAGPLLEAMYVGHLAMRAGAGKRLQWDGPAMRCTNIPEVNQYATRTCRKGWEV